MPAGDSSRWIWIDLEMTGLEVDECTIIQIATIVTDGEMRELATLDVPIWQPECALERMSPFVRKMHTDNGLLDRVRASQVSLTEAEQRTLELVARHTAYRKGILAGSSVWMDRRFLHRYMPNLESYLHYRQLDVSSLKVVFRQWYGAMGTNPPCEDRHDALLDIRASIAELKYYREHLMVSADRDTAK